MCEGEGGGCLFSSHIRMNSLHTCMKFSLQPCITSSVSIGGRVLLHVCICECVCVCVCVCVCMCV